MNNASPRIHQDLGSRRFGPLAILPPSLLPSTSKPRPPLPREPLLPYKFISPTTPFVGGPLTPSPLTPPETPSLPTSGRRTENIRSSGPTREIVGREGRIKANAARKNQDSSSETTNQMAPTGLDAFISNALVPGLPLAASPSAFALKLGALNSPPNLTNIHGLNRSPVVSFPSTSMSSRTNLAPPTLTPNMALIPSALEPPQSSSWMAMPHLFQYPDVLASSLSPDEQQYLRMAQLQAASAATNKGIPGGFKNPCTSRNYLELAMLVCNTFRGKLFPCPHCRYVTDRRNNLKRHVATMHQACDKQLECCGVTFATKSSLREHIAIFHHNGYSCAFCGRRFCRKALLKRHLSVHNGQKDYTCPHCDYATSHKSNLERHKRIHARINVIGGASSFADDREVGEICSLNEKGTELTSPSENNIIIAGNRANSNVCFQDGRLSSLEMVRAMTESGTLNSVMNLRLDRRSTFSCIDSGSSNMEGLPEFDNKNMEETKEIDNEDDFDSDSDIDIDGMEEYEFNDSVSGRKASEKENSLTEIAQKADRVAAIPQRENSFTARMCDPQNEIHPLNLVKVKTTISEG